MLGGIIQRVALFIPQMVRLQTQGPVSRQARSPTLGPIRRLALGFSGAQKVHPPRSMHTSAGRKRPAGGTEPTETYLDSYDYLGLAASSDLNELEAFFVRTHGHRLGPSSELPDSMVSQFERQAADWLGAAGSLLTECGHVTDAFLLDSLMTTTQCPVYVDRFSQQNFPVGARTAATWRTFAHNDLHDLSKVISEFGPGIVYTETVNGILGTTAPLEDIVNVCETHGCVLIASESHATGLRGPQGAGLVCELGLEDRIPFRTMSLEAAFGGRGGLVAFSEKAMHSKKVVVNNAAFPTETPFDSSAVRHLAALEYIRHDVNGREQLSLKIDRFRKGCIRHGLQGRYIAGSTSPIVPLFINSFESAKKVNDLFRSHNVYPSLYVDHSVPQEVVECSVVRFILNTSTTYEQILAVHTLLKELRSELKC